MAYQVIARKWRPQKFSDMVGQEHIARTLRNAIITGRIAQAYLFVGPRGIGKTTTARIFAKALNCEHPENGEPCCKCDSCRAIASESSVNVIEIDAATHTQVDKAREICEEVLHLPIGAKYKIYIIDEVHMLSKSAWNALLKTIEEPPAHAKFIFATTEVNKVLPTVISRCQRFDLRRIPTNLIADRLELIAKTEGVGISRPAIDVIARAADGGMRDAQSLLDQMISFFCTGSAASAITEEQALSLFGLTAPAEMFELLRAILLNNPRVVITSVHGFASAGKNLEVLFDEILVWLRGVMMCSILKNPETVIEENPERIELFRQLAAATPPGVPQRLLEQFSATGYLLREAINKQIFIETLLLKGMRLAHAPQVSDLIARLNYIRKTGELAPLDAVPSFEKVPAAIPAPEPVKVSAAIPAPVEESPEPVRAQAEPPAATVEESPEPVRAQAEPPAATVEESPEPAETRENSAPEEETVPVPPEPEEESASPGEESSPEAAADSVEDVPPAEAVRGDSAPAEEADPEEEPPVRRKSREELRAEAVKDPMVGEAIRLFNGRLTDVHENNL